MGVFAVLLVQLIKDRKLGIGIVWVSNFVTNSFSSPIFPCSPLCTVLCVCVCGCGLCSSSGVGVLGVGYVFTAVYM